MTFTQWLRKRWYIFVILCGVGAAVSQLFISNRHPVTIGLVIALAISFVIYKVQEPEAGASNREESEPEETGTDTT